MLVNQLFFAVTVTGSIGVMGRFFAAYANTPYTERLTSPVVSLGEHSITKGLLSLLATQIQIPEWLFSLVGQVFDIRPEAAFAMAFVLTFDFLSGVYASWWRKTEKLGRVARPREFLLSSRIRDSIVKVGEYVAILMLFTVASNVWAVEFGWAQRFTFMMIFFTEAWSTRENFQHAPARMLFSKIRALSEHKNPNSPSLAPDKTPKDEQPKDTA